MEEESLLHPSESMDFSPVTEEEERELLNEPIQQMEIHSAAVLYFFYRSITE
jgi:hypothetical protein